MAYFFIGPQAVLNNESAVFSSRITSGYLHPKKSIAAVFFFTMIVLHCLKFFLATSLYSTVNAQKLLVVSFDGFRYDYLNSSLTPNLYSFLPLSTHSKFLLNVFPTQTFSNHFSIATGLYTEKHGVLASLLWDAKNNKMFKYGYDLWHYDEGIIPIWTLNEKAGRHSGVMMWPGSEFDYNGTKTTHVQKYNTNVTFEQRVDKVISWFKDPKTPANFVMLYIEEPDKYSHSFGPDSPMTVAQIKKVDEIAKYIVNQFASNMLTDVNIIFLSDHGVMGVPKRNIIDLTKWVGGTSKMYGTSPVLQIYPNEGKEIEVYQILAQEAEKSHTFKIYRNNDIPDHFHYKKCKRAPPLLAVAEPNYAFQDLYDGIQWYKNMHPSVTDDNFFGVHGYDPETLTMHPYFIAIGPAFKQDYSVELLHTVDMYLLFAEVLNLNLANYETDGDFNRVAEIFRSRSDQRRMLAVLALCGVLLVLGIIMAVTTCIYCLRYHCFKKKKEPSYVKLNLEDQEDIHELT